MGQIQTLGEFLGLLIRRRWLILAVTLAGAVAAALFAASRAHVYEATALIQVELPTVTDPAAAPAASASAQRLQAIEQRLTTRENMLAVIERHALFDGLPVTNDEKVHRLRLALRFQPVAAAGQPLYGASTQVSALLISARAGTAEQAARVANDFAQGMVDAGASVQVTRLREAVAFHRSEETRLAAAIAEIDTRLAAFNNENADALPEARAFARDEIGAIDADLRGVDAQRLALTAERDRLATLGSLRETDRRRADEVATELAIAERRAAVLTDRRAVLLATLARAPQVDQTLAALDRERAQRQSELDAATRARIDAETAQKLEDSRQAERFTLLERAVAPDFPITGGRKRLAMAGALASLFAAVGLAFLMDLLHPVVRTRAQMERQLDLRPVVTIPELPRTGGFAAARPALALPATLRQRLALAGWGAAAVAVFLVAALA
jgi:uncharacterized protein involved in exopolysaccharide biosynthesis